MQIVLAFMVSGQRGNTKTSLGSGAGVAGSDPLHRAVRRHGNLAENAGLFIAGFIALELSKSHPTLMWILCAAFVISRVLHAIGLSQENTSNAFRMIGGVGTYAIGLILGALLIWVALPVVMAG